MKPNVIVILADQLRAMELGCYMQLVLRDSDPAVGEWPHFHGGYCALTLWRGQTETMALRHEHARLDEYSAGPVAAIECAVDVTLPGLRYRAKLPWAAIGPRRTGQHNPFLVRMTFNRYDHALDVPDSDRPQDWSHNWLDNFICKRPALEAWVTFG
jgi:hypothetical protein